MKLLNKMTLIVFLAWPLFAKSEKIATLKQRVSRQISSTKTEQEKLIVDYFKCFELHKENIDLKHCIDSIILPNTSSSHKDRFYSWLLVFDARLTSLNTCSSTKLKEASFFSEATPSYICGQIEIGGQAKDIVFFFKKNQKKYKLWSFYY